MIADLAVVFHWTPADVAEMDLPELMSWRERAAARSQPPKS